MIALSGFIQISNLGKIIHHRIQVFSSQCLHACFCACMHACQICPSRGVFIPRHGLAGFHLLKCSTGDRHLQLQFTHRACLVGQRTESLWLAE